jgi:(E)-4-hydroxy-3-methylbut-2-enyl-diphosphate synthase
VEIKETTMLYLSGLQVGKVFTNDMIDRIVSEVEKKASELENS